MTWEMLKQDTYDSGFSAGEERGITKTVNSFIGDRPQCTRGVQSLDVTVLCITMYKGCTSRCNSVVHHDVQGCYITM